MTTASTSRRVAVVLGGGVGLRVGLDIPKQLIKIAGHTILEHTIALLDRHPMVDEIVVTMAPGHLDAVHAIVRSGGYEKVAHVIEGGATRNETSLRALDVVGADDTMVLYHDAVRPLLSHRIVTDCFEALERYDAVDVAIPSADTIIVVDDDNVIRDIPPRGQFRRGQTPQAFRAGAIRTAYAHAMQDPDFQATDDCAVVLRYTPDVPIWVVDGEERNMKVTAPIDVYLADKLFQLSTDNLPAQRDDAGYREALAGKVLAVFGGSYGIGADLAELAASHGARVFTFSRSTTRTHVERREDVRAAREQVMAEAGRVDFVVNAAAVLHRGELAETSEETVYHATEVNYLAPILVAQEFHEPLRASRGSMLNFTSSSYTRGRSGYALYSSAKAGVVNLTQALADEWSVDGVRVNCINPERTGTPMRTKAFGDEPPGSLLESAEVARRSLDVLISGETGMVIDIRRDDPIG
ncbi:SDR family NAD(P)-dependent oxidoreductase [Nocardioides mangrovicus]|uniref:2-C-methyl-D-erythritol 4-phosphate cytidylyltransferase n=1 Tax=Nocardioides mangrovicus TaxID=2478913 RepID=A0A3L8P500_9ACTN|nr:bifunctional cytidylyltransferase/SDR family oxidoreductase [Nocardioides mangrovicus]RLV50456.1 SDR family NAD(P)-dependent oxidoreductase [Nocardioides mangrovicus]